MAAGIYTSILLSSSHACALAGVKYISSSKTSPMAADNNRFQFISLSDDIFDAIANKANEATELLEKW